MKKSDEPVVVQETYDATIEKVWQALTDVAHMRQWFFDNIPDFKPEVGFKTRFNVNTGERDFMHLWEIIEVVPLRKIVYDWSYEKYRGRGLVEFELFAGNKSTTLKLTNHVLEDFPDEIPEFKRESCIGGWTYFIKQNLKKYLEKMT